MIGEIRQALAANLSSVFTSGYQISPYVLSSPTPPTIEIDYGPEDAVEYDLAAGRGLDQFNFTVRAFVSSSQDIGAQVWLDKLLDPSGSTSVKTALESDKTLGGATGVQDVRVTSATGRKEYAVQNSVYLGCEWTVAVLIAP